MEQEKIKYLGKIDFKSKVLVLCVITVLLDLTNCSLAQNFSSEDSSLKKTNEGFGVKLGTTILWEDVSMLFEMDDKVAFYAGYSYFPNYIKSSKINLNGFNIGLKCHLIKVKESNRFNLTIQNTHMIHKHEYGYIKLNALGACFSYERVFNNKFSIELGPSINLFKETSHSTNSYQPNTDVYPFIWGHLNLNIFLSKIFEKKNR